jgi:hypothetical protein
MLLRTLSCLSVIACCVAAQAQFVFSNMQATYDVELVATSVPWNVSQNSGEGWVHFTDSTPAYQTRPDFVSTANHSSITYDVVSPTPISSMNFTFTSDVSWYGLITVNHEIFANGTMIGILNTARIGPNLTGGGVLGVRTISLTVDFSQAVTEFSVVDSFNLENFAGGNYAHLISVEHNYAPVPEPMTFLGLSLGGFAMLVRRLRKRGPRNSDQ